MTLTDENKTQNLYTHNKYVYMSTYTQCKTQRKLDNAEILQLKYLSGENILMYEIQLVHSFTIYVGLASFIFSRFQVIKESLSSGVPWDSRLYIILKE